jgi:hypothetical protein
VRSPIRDSPRPPSPRNPRRAQASDASRPPTNLSPPMFSPCKPHDFLCLLYRAPLLACPCTHLPTRFCRSPSNAVEVRATRPRGRWQRPSPSCGLAAGRTAKAAGGAWNIGHRVGPWAVWRARARIFGPMLGSGADRKKRMSGFF